MFIGKPFIQEALDFKNILNDFMLAFGTKIKPNKSQVFFFNTHHSIQTHLAWKIIQGRDILDILSYKTNNSTFGALHYLEVLVLLKWVLQSLLIYKILALVAPKVILSSTLNLMRSFLLEDWPRNISGHLCLGFFSALHLLLRKML